MVVGGYITRDRTLFQEQCIEQAQLNLRLLFGLKPKEMAKMKLLAIWKDQK